MMRLLSIIERSSSKTNTDNYHQYLHRNDDNDDDDDDNFVQVVTQPSSVGDLKLI